MVKDLVTENVDGTVICFCEDASNIVNPDKSARIVGTPVVSVKIGDHCYYGLCDMGPSASPIPFSLYQEVMHEIAPCEIEDIDVTIKLANRDSISPVGIVRDVEVICGKVKYPTDFLVLGTIKDEFCPIIFGRPFLNTCGVVIDFKKEKVTVKFEGETYEFNFSKFARQCHDKELPNEDNIIERIASIAIPPDDPLQHYLLDHENEMFMQEREEIENIFLRQPPILKHNLPVETLGMPTPPKGDHVFELKTLLDTLKYAYLDENKIYPVIINSNLLGEEEEKLLTVLR